LLVGSSTSCGHKIVTGSPSVEITWVVIVH
jgi:hypothetical protein